MVELADTKGLICGFQLRADGISEPLNWDIASDPNRRLEGAVWLHFSLADVRAKKWIGACEQIPTPAREMLLDTDSHIRLERSRVDLQGCWAISTSNSTATQIAWE